MPKTSFVNFVIALKFRLLRTIGPAARSRPKHFFPGQRSEVASLPIVAAIVGLSFYGVSAGWAQTLSDDPRFGEIWRKSQVLRDQPAMDSTPISFSIVGVNYKVPRNYISHMDNYQGGPQDLVYFRATFPGFEPLTEKTKQCLTQPQAFWPAGCIPIQFWIYGKADLTDDDHFNNSRDLFHSQIAKEGPAGFELYETGPDDARVETYRKKTLSHTLFIQCFGNKRNNGIMICDNFGSPLVNGNGLHYRLNYNQLEKAEEIDAGIRKLVASFTTITGDSQ